MKKPLAKKIKRNQQRQVARVTQVAQVLAQLLPRAQQRALPLLLRETQVQELQQLRYLLIMKAYQNTMLFEHSVAKKTVCGILPKTHSYTMTHTSGQCSTKQINHGFQTQIIQTGWNLVLYSKYRV